MSPLQRAPHPAPLCPKSVKITLSLIPVVPPGWRRGGVTSAGAVALKHKIQTQLEPVPHRSTGEKQLLSLFIFIQDSSWFMVKNAALTETRGHTWSFILKRVDEFLKPSDNVKG